MRRARAVIVAAPLALLAGVASAHVPQLRGRLVDLVARSDLIAIGVVESTRAVDARTHLTTIRVAAILDGQPPGASVAFRADPRLTPGRRYVVFLRRSGDALECVQESGTVFPAEPTADAAYQQAVSGIRRAARADETERIALLRAALIPALSSPAAPLRYYAVLDLAALSHHPLSDADRLALERLMASDATDPAIRPILGDLLRTTP